MTLKFSSPTWAVFNLHVNAAGERAMNVCRLAFPDSKELAALERMKLTGIMEIFDHKNRGVVTDLFAHACFIFANDLDKVTP